MKKRHVSLVLALLCVLAVFVGSLAYFTDHIQAGATATAGTLNLNLSEITTKKAGSAAGATEKFKPGEGIEIGYTLTNAGNKSADVREILVLTSDTAMTGTNTVPCEFELYNASDVTLDAQGLATVNSGASPITVRSISADKKQVTYAIPQFILNGTETSTAPGVTTAETEVGALGTSKTGAYVLVFKNTAGNDFQNISLTLDYEAQAKQHRNTDDNTWAIIKTETVSFAGNTSYKAVPVMADN